MNDEIRVLLEKITAMIHDIEVQTALVKAYLDRLKALNESEGSSDGSDH